MTDEPAAGVVVDFADSRVQRALAALELLAGVEVESMCRADLDMVVTARRDVLAFTDALEMRIARRSRQLAAEGRSEPAADLLLEHGRRSAREAAAAAGRERACEQLPTFETALGDGAVSTGHLDVLANVTAKLDDAARAEFVAQEAVLLADARRSSVDTFERHCRDLTRSIAADAAAGDLERQRQANRIKHWIDKLTGMGHIHTELDPESHARVLAAINNQLRTLRHQQRTQRTTTPTTVPADPVAPLSYDQLEAQAFIDIAPAVRPSTAGLPT